MINTPDIRDTFRKGVLAFALTLTLIGCTSSSAEKLNATPPRTKPPISSVESTTLKLTLAEKQKALKDMEEFDFVSVAKILIDGMQAQTVGESTAFSFLMAISVVDMDGTQDKYNSGPFMSTLPEGIKPEEIGIQYYLNTVKEGDGRITVKVGKYLSWNHTSDKQASNGVVDIVGSTMAEYQVELTRSTDGTVSKVVKTWVGYKSDLIENPSEEELETFNRVIKFAEDNCGL